MFLSAPDFSTAGGQAGVKADRVQKGVRGGCRGEAAQQGEARVATAALSERRRLIRSRQVRRIFFREFFRLVRVVWPTSPGFFSQWSDPDF